MLKPETLTVLVITFPFLIFLVVGLPYRLKKHYVQIEPDGALLQNYDRDTNQYTVTHNVENAWCGSRRRADGLLEDLMFAGCKEPLVLTKFEWHGISDGRSEANLDNNDFIGELD